MSPRNTDLASEISIYIHIYIYIIHACIAIYIYIYIHTHVYTYIQGDIDTYATPQWPQAEKDIIPCLDVGPRNSSINGKVHFFWI